MCARTQERGLCKAQLAILMADTFCGTVSALFFLVILPPATNSRAHRSRARHGLEGGGGAVATATLYYAHDGVLVTMQVGTCKCDEGPRANCRRQTPTCAVECMQDDEACLQFPV